MKSYSQNAEDLFVANYFGDFKGTLLSIGENNGRDLSNALLLIEQEWFAHVVEPSYAFNDLQLLHRMNNKVQCYNLAIADAYGIVTLYESGAHVPGGNDRALVSSLSKVETERWSLAGVKFEEVPVQTVPFNTFWEMTDFAKFDFITIDAESYDKMILKQIDLKSVDCKCLCIEHNGDQDLKNFFTEYCSGFGLVPATSNRENIIFIK